jgi:AraC family transcriptional regulator, arabinose operon regulatory protein
MQDKLFKNTFNHSPNPMAKENWIFITSVSHYRHTADDTSFYRDYAQGFQMFYTVSGQGWLDYEGTYQKIMPGTITCVDLEKRHGFGAAPGSIWEHYWLICHGKAFEDIYTLIFNKNNVQALQQPSQLSDCFKQLFFSKQSNSVYFDIDAMATVMQVCSALINQNSTLDIKQDPFSTTLKQVIDFINNNYSSELDIAALAEKSGYSRFHFSRLFKAHTGFSPGSYITKIRLEKAKDMLSKSDLPIEIIAEKVGFNTVNYFIRAFKEQEHITPGKYRRTQSF